MGRLIAHRLLATIPVLLLVTAGVFALLHLTPGDPIDAMMAESVDATAKDALRRELGLDRPIPVQYAAWMGRLLRGDLGRSIRNGEPVIENVSRRLRPSLELALFAMTISLVVAFPVGIVSAIRRNTAVDRAGATFALFGICMPNFLLALLLIFLFGVTLRWLPISGYTDPLEEPWNGLRSLALPAITLGLALAAVVTRTLRSSLLEALAEDYVRTARAKGLSEWRIIWSHVLKNALIPVVTVLGLQLGTLIGGAVITEYVFALPGVGRLVVDAVFARDYPLHPEQSDRRRPLWLDRSPDPISLRAPPGSRVRPHRRSARSAGRCCAVRRAPGWRRSARRSWCWRCWSRSRRRSWRPTIRSPRISATRWRRRDGITCSERTTWGATCSRGWSGARASP